MLSIEKAQNIIEKEIERLVIPTEPKNLYKPVRYILENGGKRIRPALLLVACDMFNSDFMKALYPALGIEVFHNFTLLHDDLMDNSAIRRSKPTVHIKWDSNTAILSGDVMSILANNLMGMVDKEVVFPVTRLFNKTAMEVCEGQMLDMEYALRESVSIPEYINMIRLKTSVLIAASLGIGSLIGGASECDADILYKFGINLGLAFQIQDDYLDSFGDPKIFGKKIGMDILANKRTFLAISAFEKASGKDQEYLKKLFSVIDSDPAEKIQNVLNLYEKYGIRDSAKNKILNLHLSGIEYLNSLNIPAERKKWLLEFSEVLLNRKK